MRTALALITVLCVTACGGSAGSGQTGTNAQASAAQSLKFSACMRSHGVPNFPDPSAGGGIEIKRGSGLNPQAPAFRAAQKVCFKLLPGGGPTVQRPTKAQVAAGLAFARCMRSHGLPGFPDPVTSGPSGSGPLFSLDGMTFKPSSSIQPDSPAFRQAAAKCGVRLPSAPP